MTSPDVDHGWAWAVMLAAFGSQCVAGILLYGTGVFLVGLLEEFDDAVATTSLVGSIFTSLYCLMGPLSSYIINRYNCRVATMIGACIAIVGFTTSAFVTRLDVLALTYGVIAGIGTSLSGIPSVVVVGFNFKKYLGLAVGFNVTGAGVGMLASGPLIHHFLNKYGVSGTFLMMAGLVAQTLVFGAIMRTSSLEKEYKIAAKINTTTSNGCIAKCSNSLSIFRNKGFSVLLLSFLLWNIPYAIVLLHLPYFAMIQGASDSSASSLITVIGLGSTLNRVLTGLTQGPGGIDPMLLYMGFQGIIGVLTLTFPLYSVTFVGQIVYGLIVGAYTGGLMVLMNPVAIDMAGLPELPVAIGLMYFLSGVGFIVGPPLAGYIVDAGGSYETSFYISGGCLLLGSFLSLVSALWRSDIPEEEKASSFIDLKGSKFLSGSIMMSGSVEIINQRVRQISESSNIGAKGARRFRHESFTSDTSSRKSYESLNLPHTVKLRNCHYLTVPEGKIESIHIKEIGSSNDDD